MAKTTKPPPAPDPYAASAAQTQANKEAVAEAARYNMTNEVSPYGTLTYNRATDTTGPGEYVREVALSPEGQRQFDIQNQISELLGNYAISRAGDVSTDSFSLDGLPAAPDPTAFGQDAAAVEKATYDSIMSRLNPDFADQRLDFANMMETRGLPTGGGAYTKGLRPILDAQTSATEQAARDAVTAGRAEQSRLFGLSGATRDRALSEMLTERSIPINEVSAALQGSPAMATPQFAGQWQAPTTPTDVAGNIYGSWQADAQRASILNQANAAKWGGIYGLIGQGAQAGAMAYGMSDRRVKKDIKKLDGPQAYEFRYKWEPNDAPKHVGLMAQDVEKVRPDAVKTIFGIKAVDYGALANA